jgi:hypothetical protein
MNWWDSDTEQWVPSDPSFAVSADGTAFVADKIQDPTKLAANLNCMGAVTVTTPAPNNVTLRSTPLAIGLYDAASGKSVIVAALTNTTGVLVDPQHVVYQNAFVGGGFAASVVYSLPDTGSFSQDVVFTGFNPDFDPTVWGFAAGATNTLQLQVFTEFYDPPQPQTNARPIYIEQDPVKRATMASPDFIDYTLDFGNYVLGPGQAHGKTTNSVAVAKDFVSSSGRTFLVESIPFLPLQRLLQDLPPVGTNTSSITPHEAKKSRVAAASLPKLRESSRATIEKKAPSTMSALAGVLPKGVVADYIAIVSSSSSPVVFSGDTTYYVSGNVYENGPVTIEGGAVFKSPPYGGIIWCYNTVTTATTNYRPAIFTAADDNTAGSPLSTTFWSGYTGNPNQYASVGYGVTGLWLYAATSATINNVEFRYQFNGLAAGYGGNAVITLSDCQFVNSLNGTIFEPGAPITLNLNNCLFANLQYPAAQSHSFPITVNACNCTFDTLAYSLFYADGSWNGTASFNMINSILSNVALEFDINSGSSFQPTGAYNVFYNAGQFGSQPTYTPSTDPYQTVGEGSHYLLDPAHLVKQLIKKPVNRGVCPDLSAAVDQLS